MTALETLKARVAMAAMALAAASPVFPRGRRSPGDGAIRAERRFRSMLAHNAQRLAHLAPPPPSRQVLRAWARRQAKRTGTA